MATGFTILTSLGDLKVSQGQFTMNGATPVVVPNKAVGPNSVIVITLATIGGTPAASFISATADGVSFSVTGTAGDTGIYNYLIIG